MSENHSQAARLARRACNQAKVDSVGIGQLENLLGAKSDVSYGDQTVATERALALSIAAERFQAWAEKRIAEKGKR